MKFENVIAFSEQSKEAKDLAQAMKEFAKEVLNERRGLKGFEKHSRDEMNTLINKAFAQELSRAVGEEIPTNKTALQRFVSRTNVKELANETRDVLIDMILPDVLMTSPLQYISEIKYADFGDTIKFEIASNQLLTVSKAGNRQRETNVQKTYRNDVTMAGENHQISVGTNLFDIMIGKSYLAEEVMKGALAVETHLLFSTFDAFDGAMGTLAGNLAVNNYSEKALIKLCETVTAWNGGRKAIIIGTPVALKSVLPDNSNYRYFLDSEYVKLGHIRDFNGYGVIPMEQVADPYNASEDYALKFDDSKLYVVSPASDKLVKIGIFGGTMSHQSDAFDNANLSVINTLNETFEVSVITNSVAGVVKSIG